MRTNHLIIPKSTYRTTLTLKYLLLTIMESSETMYVLTIESFGNSGNVYICKRVYFLGLKE